MSEEESPVFDFCKNVDIHAIEFNIPIQAIGATAAEHSFRGIVTDLSRLKDLVSYLDKYTDKTVLPICLIDFPFGNLSHDVRNYCILSAKEKSAKEVEITAPYSLIARKDFHAVYVDMENLLKTADNAKIDVKYVLDINNKVIDETARIKLCKAINGMRFKYVTTGCGFYDNWSNHKDNIISMRKIKEKCPDCKIKTYLEDLDEQDLSMYIKAGSDIIGLPYKIAPNLIQLYNQLILKKETI